MSAAGWRKAAPRALAFGLGFLVVMGATDAFNHRSFRFTKLNLLISVVVALLELLRGVLHEKGWVTTAKMFVWVTIVGGFGAGQILQYKTEARQLSDTERAPLVAVGAGEDRRLLHPTLGFSIRDPGPDFTLTAAPDFGGTAQFRAYKNTAGDVTLFLGLLKGTGESEASLRDWLSAMKDLLAGNTSQRLDVTRLETSGGARPTGRLRGWIRGPLGESSYRLNANGFSKDGTGYTFFVAVASAEPDALSEVLTSFEPLGPP